MECPKCGNDLEFEEIKWPCGDFYCTECDYENSGEQFPVSDGDGNLEYIEKLY